MRILRTGWRQALNHRAALCLSVTGLALVLTGCVGVEGGGYYGGTAVVDTGPDVVFWGGDYHHSHDAYRYSHRGYESRAVAHPSNFHGGGHPGGGHPAGGHR